MEIDVGDGAQAAEGAGHGRGDRRTRIAQLVRDRKIGSRQAARREVHGDAFGDALEFACLVHQTARECRGTVVAPSFAADQPPLERRTGVEIERVLVAAAVDHGVAIDMGEDDRVGARDRSHADQRQRHVGHGADGERHVLRIGQSGPVAAAVPEVEIELLIGGAEIEHEGRALGMHQRRVDRQLALEIPGDHIHDRDGLRDRQRRRLPPPVVVAEDECLAAAAELDRFEVREAVLARHDGIPGRACGSGEAADDSHPDLGRNDVAVRLERAIGRGGDADLAARDADREPGVDEIRVAPRSRRDSGLECGPQLIGQSR